MSATPSSCVADKKYFDYVLKKITCTKFRSVANSFGNIIKPAIAREEVNGTFWFFDPKIGWQFKRVQISVD